MTHASTYYDLDLTTLQGVKDQVARLEQTVEKSRDDLAHWAKRPDATMRKGSVVSLAGYVEEVAGDEEALDVFQEIVSRYETPRKGGTPNPEYSLDDLEGYILRCAVAQRIKAANVARDLYASMHIVRHETYQEIFQTIRVHRQVAADRATKEA